MDVQLKVRTEYSFNFNRKVYGKLQEVVDALPEGTKAAAIADNTAFGHVAWHKACKEKGIKPILGISVSFTDREDIRHYATLLAKNSAGLAELYGLASEEELTFDRLVKSSQDVIKIIPGNESLATRKGWYLEISPAWPNGINKSRAKAAKAAVLTSDNYYPRPQDRSTFELFGGDIRLDPRQPQHILSASDRLGFFKEFVPAYATSLAIADSIDCPLPMAPMISVKGDLERICRAGIKVRFKDGWSKKYEERLVRELGMIRRKNYESYFLVISDMVRWAKKRMLVGPARGSAAGSIVCYLCDITDVDPILHDLIFERFIDVTRSDLPDIDLDFPDKRREEVIQYLQKKYGAENVAHIGTVMTWQPKSILNEFSKRLNIPPWELAKLQGAMIVRSSGDSRAASCLIDTLETLDIGREIVQKYGTIKNAAAFEGHAKHAGTHAAGIIVCNEPIAKFCVIKGEDRIAQIDKIDAEKVGLLKIDVLGLRTLSVIDDCLQQIPGPRLDLNKVPLDDEKAFAILNDRKYAGIFQFEGDAVQMLAKRMDITRFADISALGALARPGPLDSGGATEYTDRKMARSDTVHLHPLVQPFTDETYGIIVYQEQIMIIGREVGDLDWEDINQLRRAMSKSLGKEFFDRYFEKFAAGALRKHNLNEKESRNIWNNMNTAGSWSFNKSHAVAYGLISYWCAWLKAHHLLPFAAATLRNSKDDEQTIQILRELTNEGIVYEPFDVDRSQMDWSVADGKLLGGFLNLKGIGPVKAERMIKERAANGKLSDKSCEVINKAEIQFLIINPAQHYFAKLYENPRSGGFVIRKIDRIIDIADKDRFSFIGRLSKKNPRDLNEYKFQVQRMQEGRPQFLERDTQYLNLILEDDTGNTWCTVSASNYPEVGKPIVNNGVEGKSWYVVQGYRNRLGRVSITWVKEITPTL